MIGSIDLEFGSYKDSYQSHFAFPIYDGSGDLSLWKQKATEYFSFHRTPIGHRVTTASFHLQGKAIEWYWGFLARRASVSWLEFLNGLDSCFGSSTTSSTNNPGFKQASPVRHMKESVQVFLPPIGYKVTAPTANVVSTMTSSIPDLKPASSSINVLGSLTNVQDEVSISQSFAVTQESTIVVQKQILQVEIISLCAPNITSSMIHQDIIYNDEVSNNTYESCDSHRVKKAIGMHQSIRTNAPMSQEEEMISTTGLFKSAPLTLDRATANEHLNVIMSVSGSNDLKREQQKLIPPLELSPFTRLGIFSFLLKFKGVCSMFVEMPHKAVPFQMHMGFTLSFFVHCFTFWGVQTMLVWLYRPPPKPPPYYEVQKLFDFHSHQLQEMFGEAISGIGNLGCQGMEIPIRELVFDTALGGVMASSVTGFEQAKLDLEEEVLYPDAPNVFSLLVDPKRYAPIAGVLIDLISTKLGSETTFSVLNSQLDLLPCYVSRDHQLFESFPRRTFRLTFVTRVQVLTASFVSNAFKRRSHQLRPPPKPPPINNILGAKSIAGVERWLRS